mgnify:CR=1 FL=1
MGVNVKLDWDNDSIKCDYQFIEASADSNNWERINPYGQTKHDAGVRTYTFDQTAPNTRKMYYRIGSVMSNNVKWSDPIELMVTGTDDIAVSPTNVTGEVIVV